VNWILDLKGIFDKIEKEHLMEMEGRRIAEGTAIDPRRVHGKGR
jgi:hypothetical protein